MIYSCKCAERATTKPRAAASYKCAPLSLDRFWCSQSLASACAYPTGRRGLNPGSGLMVVSHPISQLGAAQQIFASIPKYIELCNKPLQQIQYMLQYTIGAESHKEKGNGAKENIREPMTHQQRYKQPNDEGATKDNLASIMLVICPNHS